MNQAQVELGWIEDRSRLIACRDRHRAVTDFYTKRDRALSQKEPNAPPR